MQTGKRLDVPNFDTCVKEFDRRCSTTVHTVYVARGDGVMIHGILRFLRKSTGSQYLCVVQYREGKQFNSACEFRPGNDWIFDGTFVTNEIRAQEFQLQFTEEPWPVEVIA